MYDAWGQKKMKIKMSVSGVKCPSAVNSGADGDYREYCGKERRIETQSKI